MENSKPEKFKQQKQNKAKEKQKIKGGRDNTRRKEEWGQIYDFSQQALPLLIVSEPLIQLKLIKMSFK